MAVLVGKKAPVFNAPAVTNGGTVVENFSLDPLMKYKKARVSTKNFINQIQVAHCQLKVH